MSLLIGNMKLIRRIKALILMTGLLNAIPTYSGDFSDSMWGNLYGGICNGVYHHPHGNSGYGAELHGLDWCMQWERDLCSDRL